MKRALREIADHNTAGSNDAPATARAGRRRTRSATRRAAEEEPSAPAPAAPPRRRRRRAPAPAPAEPELPGSDDVVPAPAPAPAPAQPPAPAPQQVVDLTRDDDAADTPAAAPPPPPAPAPAPPAPAQPPAPPPQVDQQPARHRNVFGYAATTVEPPPPSDRRHLASKRAPAPGRGATIVGVRSTKPRDPLAAALRPAPKRPKKRSARERLAAAAAEAPAPAPPRPPAPPPPPRPAPPPRRLAPARAPPGAAPPPRRLAPPDPRQTCDACGAPACLETDRGGGDAASYAFDVRRPRRWRAAHAIDAASSRRWRASRRRRDATRGSRAGAACLYHWFAGAAFRRGRSRVVARDRIDSAAPRVEGAWQRAFARAAEAVGVEAAKRLAERQQAPDDDDPFGALLGEAEASRRKPTRPTQLYARAGEEIVVTRDEDRADGWPCVACGSCRTDREPLGGGNLQTHKTETWGSKDAPDSMWAVACRACGHEWRTEA